VRKHEEREKRSRRSKSNTKSTEVGIPMLRRETIRHHEKLGNFIKNKRFYMSSYLIFVVTYCHVFNGLPLAKKLIVNLTLCKCGTPHFGNKKLHIMSMK
jgi:hypothetical protein